MTEFLSRNGNGKRANQIIDWAVRLLILSGVVFAYKVGDRLTRLETVIEAQPSPAELRAFMEGDRFTAEDGHDLEADIKAWTEDRYPPQWLRDDLTEIKQLVSVLPAMSIRLSALEERVRNLEQQKE